jgi:xylulose-5-phosphate/fructose-6-phosphate phosphoketolase
VVFAFHGYRAAIHEIIHGRPNSSRFHVHGFQEQGTTTTPFNMVVMNEMSRFHLAKQAIRRGMKSTVRTDHLQERLDRAIQEATAHALENFEDPADIHDWTWQG